jgi:hypothetical protein
LQSLSTVAFINLFAPANEGLRTLVKAVGNERNIAAKPPKGRGAAAHVQADSMGMAKGRCG